MDRTAALVRLRIDVAADSRPVLSQAVLDTILDDARVIDPNGRRPTDPAYVPTWNLAYAARRGWEAKAALVAGDFTFSADGASYSKGDVLANIERMISLWRAKDTGVITTGEDREANLVPSLRLGVNNGTV